MEGRPSSGLDYASSGHYGLLGAIVIKHCRNTVALKLPAVWSNVAVEGRGNEHGELTLLRKLLLDMEGHRGNPKALVTVHLGGVKLGCQACC